jgi:hypothetical protein
VPLHGAIVNVQLVDDLGARLSVHAGQENLRLYAIGAGLPSSRAVNEVGDALPLDHLWVVQEDGRRSVAKE